MPDDPSVIRWKVQTRMRDMPDLDNHGGVAEGQVVAFQGVAVVSKVQKRLPSRGVVVLEAHLDPIELVVGEAVPLLRRADVELLPISNTPAIAEAGK